MKKKVILGLISLLCVGSTCLTSCMKDGVDGKDGINGVDGSAGADGKDGSQIYTGTGTPNSETGNIGDLYIDTESGDMYSKGESGWIKTGNIKGAKGNDGTNGKDGVSIKGVSKTSSAGNVDIYTITYSDGSTSSFTVTNGTDGQPGATGQKGDDGHTPTVTIGTNGNWYVDGQDTGYAAKGPKGDAGTDGTDGVSIVSVVKTDTTGVNDTYTIYYSDNTTSTFNVHNGTDGKDGHTPVVTIGSDGYWYVDDVNTGVKAKGDKGDTGNGISSVSKTSSDGNVDTYTITYTDGSTSTFTVTNGTDGKTPYIGENGHWWIGDTDTGVNAKGDKGDKGDTGATGETGAKGDKGDAGVDGDTPYIGSNGHWWIDDVDTGVCAEGSNGLTPYVGDNGNWFLGNTDTGVVAKANGIAKIVLASTNGKVKTYCIYFTDGSTFVFSISDGNDGANGKTPYVGSNGNWWIDNTDTNVLALATNIVSISLTSSVGNVDTYTVELSNGEKYTFTVTNGNDGEDGLTPYIGSNGNWWIGETDTGVHAKGDKGDTGATGKSAYEIYCDENPSYTGTEEEWLHSLVNGDLADDITITIDTSGGNVMDPITCRPNSYIEVSDPTRLGYVFDGWYLNGSLIDLNTYIFRTSCTITAHYRAADIAVTLDPSGGNVTYDTLSIKYGSTYKLPTPTKNFQTFDGWYYGNNKVELSGKWTIKDDCILVAKWNKKTINVSLSVDSEYGTCDTTSVSLKAGDTFTLPVPTSITESTFQGWFYGDTQVTDSSGKSLGTLDFDSDVVLNAKYYIEITNIYQILSMSNSESTTGNYKIMNDLDFDGVEMSPIENFSGVFDGGNHTLSNINIINGTGEYGGMFGTISRKATIKNMTISKMEMSGTWEIAGGLIGATIGEVKTDLTKNVSNYTTSEVTYDVNVDNIKFENSFNTSLNVTDSFGAIIGKYLYDLSGYYDNSWSYYKYYYYNHEYKKLLTSIVILSNIVFSDCLKVDNSNSAYCIGSMFLTSYTFFKDIYDNDISKLKSLLLEIVQKDAPNGLINVDGIKLTDSSGLN